ncbi:metallophosphoesterase [Pelagibacterium xiamenense]|uniref:metallophosphoesterase n=1 Tax=Pelagibacterium xiamenense TaxID=2901140 RepID=UPI001E5952B6|nr:metallophosphoesterase [Pelagibacterium xiamenense]MCD7059669.1 metallophosphoesterase [Pelagibacterium xiamenense]
MIGGFLNALFGGGPAGDTPRARLEADEMPAVLYAVGDVHGRLDLLTDLEAQIYADGTAYTGEKWIVMLGDLTDRGPHSAQVLDHVLTPVPEGWRRICLCGNHDHAMAMAVRDRAMLEQWLSFGGVETLASYGLELRTLTEAEGNWSKLRAILESHIPPEHIAFLKELPIVLALPGYVFVHAGLRPGVPLDRQTDYDMMWIRADDITGQDDFPFTIVHGHTPVSAIDLSSQIINVDTGAYASGILSAVRLGAGLRPGMLQTTADPFGD